MKSKWTGLVLGLMLLACGDRAADDRGAQAVGEPIYVDVRTAQEFSGGHVAGAFNIPHDQMQLRYRELQPYRDHRIIVYCRSGRRSEVAVAVLREQGFPFVENGGAFDALVAAGVSAER